MYTFEKDTSIHTGSFLLPAEEYRGPGWPVVACDQYTSQPAYWKEREAETRGAPSTLNLILPECWLDQAAERVPKIQQTMREYQTQGVFAPALNGLVLIRRTIPAGDRWGLLVTVDLERYDFSPDSQSAIRPTEGTITERIPPRLAVRAQAPLELSHVLLLADDPQHTLIEPFAARKDSLPLLYDIELSGSGGRLTGWAITEEAALCAFFGAVRALEARSQGLSFAVGDGNHSLATARAHWLKVRESLSGEARLTHPARYAMAELINLHDPALVFEPIHRAVFGASPSAVFEALKPCEPVMDLDHPDFILAHAKGDYPLRISNPLHELPVGTVQKLLDRAGFRVDYIHGEDALRGLVQEENAVGILLPAINKFTLFPAVRQNGPLPRKCFSMGEAPEKRYYMEARAIIG